MKAIYSKIISGVLLIALLMNSSGCMTYSAVHKARGYTNETVPVSKGDKLIVKDGVYYVFQHPKDEDVSKLSLPDNMPKTKQPWMWTYYLYKPRPSYYAWLPLSVPADIATSPVQGIVFLLIGITQPWKQP
jgi:hypothetical protein